MLLVSYKSRSFLGKIIILVILGCYCLMITALEVLHSCTGVHPESHCDTADAAVASTDEASCAQGDQEYKRADRNQRGELHSCSLCYYAKSKQVPASRALFVLAPRSKLGQVPRYETLFSGQSVPSLLHSRAPPFCCV